MSGARAFGAQAAAWAARLDGIPAIVVDQTDPARGLEAAVQARMRGEPCYVAVQFDEPRAAVALALGAAVVEQQPAIDLRHALLDQIAAGSLQLGNGQTQQGLTTLGPPTLTTLRHVFDSADSLLVRSWAEHERLMRHFGRTRPVVRRFAPEDPGVPPASGGSVARDTIVVWAPQRPARELALFAIGFDEMDVPLVVVSAGGSVPPGLRARFVGRELGAAALARALIVVDAELSDPGTARALAAYGVPLAVATTSGAQEYLEPAFAYEPWNWRSIFRAGMAALGSAASPRDTGGGGPLAAPQLPAAPLPADPPLVSIVTPTYNRRERVARCLRRWSEHRYPALEHVLVNDGGESIDDLGAAYPHARVVNLPENLGLPGALNAGVAAARGTYLVLAADDDEYAPDHVALLVAALARTGKPLAHTNTVIRHEPVIDGAHTTVGYSLLWNNPLDRTAVLTGGVLALQSVLLRRELFAEAGWYDPELPHARDYAMIAELAKRNDFVHVDSTTLVYSLRTDPSSERFRVRSREPVALRMIYERSPAPDRPAIAAQRAQALAHSEHTGSAMFNDPALRLPPASHPVSEASPPGPPEAPALPR